MVMAAMLVILIVGIVALVGAAAAEKWVPNHVWDKALEKLS
jgi:hypothetical protein